MKKKLNGSIVNRDQLLAVKRKRVATINVDGIGHVCIKVLNTREALAVELRFSGDRDSPEALATLISAQLAAFICDESGNNILSIGDATKLVDQWSANQVRAVIREGTKLNALGSDSVEEAGGN